MRNDSLVFVCQLGDGGHRHFRAFGTAQRYPDVSNRIAVDLDGRLIFSGQTPVPTRNYLPSVVVFLSSLSSLLSLACYDGICVVWSVQTTWTLLPATKVDVMMSIRGIPGDSSLLSRSSTHVFCRMETNYPLIPTLGGGHPICLYLLPFVVPHFVHQGRKEGIAHIFLPLLYNLPRFRLPRIFSHGAVLRGAHDRTCMARH